MWPNPSIQRMGASCSVNLQFLRQRRLAPTADADHWTASRMMGRLLLALLICCCRGTVVGSPASDLSSPSQEVRDAAARLLRTNYAVPSRTNWEWAVNTITNGMGEAEVLRRLSPLKVKPDEGGVNAAYILSYRLDDAWQLNCRFSKKDGVLFDRKLELSLRTVWVEPPTNFTGMWVTYRANGQTNCQIDYDKGKWHGAFISYYANGSKAVVQHYDHGVIEGTETGYYPSGRTNYRGFYKAGMRVGAWIRYNEDSTTNSIKDYSKQ